MTRGSSSSLENIHLNSSDHHHHHHANRYALRAKNLIKTYKTGDIFNSTKLYVLNNLEINVRKGHIYGLLGPSGCGKTTLLKCLLGLVEIDSGEIHIHDELKCQKEKNQFRVDLSKLGFMPQDACLYFELTIKETFYYFGKLYKLDDKEIKRRAEFLVDLLDLPTTDRLACYLSGGQLRRTSLAVTLFNQPSMLVLDEPTVGMDPVLRKKIWNYLIELARKQRTTIIITTHYIEEARKAECLGFMRHGRIIEENSPEHFIHKYKHHILEDVFYAICIKDPENAESDDDDHFTTAVVSHVPLKSVRESTTFLSKSPRKLSEISEEDNAENRTPKPSQSESQKQQEMTFGLFTIISLSRIIANIYKDLIKCKRNKKLMVVQLIVPLIQITLFCTCIGRPPLDIPVGFVDNEPSGQFVRLGRQFIDEIDNTTITKKFFTKFDDGMIELRKGNIWCLIEIDRNFTREMAQSYIKKKFVGGFDNSIHVYCDNTNHQISYAIRDSLLRAIRDLVERYFLKFQSKNTDEDINFEPEAEYSNKTDFDISYIDEDIYNLTSFHSDTKKSNKYPIVFEESVFGENEPVFTNFMAPGISLSVIFFMSVAATASNFVLERQLGLIERSYLIGVKTIEILVSQLIVYSLIMLLQIAIIFCLLFGFFQLPLRGSLALLVILTFSQGFCGLCYGLFLASVIFDQETAIQATLASFYPFLLMSGIIWPIEAQPVWLKSISSYLPLTYASESFRAILEKNWDLSNYYVLRGFVATYLWTILFSICFLLMFSRKFK